MAPELRSFFAKSKSREASLLFSFQGNGDWDLGLDGLPRGRLNCLSGLWKKAKGAAAASLEFARSDPRKAVYAAKMGLALTLVTLLMFHVEPFRHLSTYSLWAILTVVIVFEFNIGSTLSKGFNRALGTLSAGGLALVVAELSTMTDKWEESVIILSIFIIGSCTSFIKLYPTTKPYEYGLLVFVLTFCYIIVSGYQTREFVETAVSRVLLIALGAAVGLVVNICIYPIWAGEDLQNLVVKNFMGVARSLEGCVTGYIQCVEYDRIPSKILTYQASDDPVYSGYRSAVESTSKEDILLGFATWEPPHGPYKMLKYPWKNYVKVSGALRHCAFMVMALHGCILSEIQASPEKRQVFKSELQRVGTEGAEVLRELGNRVKTMTKLSSMDILLQVDKAAVELQKKVDQRSYVLVNSERWEIGKRPDGMKESIDCLSIVGEQDQHLGAESFRETFLDVGSVQSSKSWDALKTVDLNSLRAAGTREIMYARQVSWPVRRSLKLDEVPSEEEELTYESACGLSLATFASLLIEFVARLQNLVDAFKELSENARFKEPVDEVVVKARGTGLWTRIGNCVGLKNCYQEELLLV